MIESKIRNISGKVSRSSIFLSRSLLDSNRIERNLEKKSLVLKSKLVEQRGRTLAGIASRSRETQKGGILGGALGLLISGGSLLRRKPKTPKSPSQLLRMQRGTSNLSRAGRLGKLARPLAVVGTGLDFVGRRAEGQTNLQAGVGAGGGLAGAIGGAKIGAAIGTAILPGAGTAIGGLGGSIIGGLVGGNLADILTGANRRRQFEVQRTVLRTQKTLFSRALDDFDDVLDNFEKIPIGFDKKRRNEEIEARRRGRPRFRLPKIRLKNFFQRPTVRNIGVTALAIGTTVLVLKFAPVLIAKGAILLPAIKKASAVKGFSKMTLEKQLRLIAKEIGRKKLIDRMTKAFDKNNKTVIKPGVKAAKRDRIFKKLRKKRQAEEQKNIERDQTKKIRESIKGMKDFMKESGFVEPSKLERRATELFSSDLRDLQIMKSKGQISQAQFDLAVNRLKLNLKITLDRIGQYSDAIREFSLDPKNFDAKGNIIGKNLNDMVRKLDIFSGKVLPEINMENLIMKNLGPAIKRRLQEIIQKPKQDLIEPRIEPKGKFRFESPDLSSNDLEPPSSTNLAQALGGDIFLLNSNRNNQQQSPPIINDQNDIGMTPVTFSPYTAVAQQIIFESSLTA